jgi:hypothetical protein
MQEITMKKLTVIGLTGLTGSGKDAAADVLVANASFTKLSFADPVRAEIMQAFGVSLLDLTRPETQDHPITALAIKRCSDAGFAECLRQHFRLLSWNSDTLAAPRSPRQIMQLWRTDYRRHQHLGYWTLKMFHRVIAERQQGRHNIVIPDCCEANEIDLVRQLYGGQIWRIHRPGIEVHGAYSAETTGTAFSPEVTLRNIAGLDSLETMVLDAFMYSASPEILYDESVAPFVAPAIAA